MRALLERLVQVAFVLPVLVACFVGVPLLAWGLVRGGWEGGHPSWVALGALVGALWLFLAAVAIKKRTPA
jgi:hypothetical protein